MCCAEIFIFAPIEVILTDKGAFMNKFFWVFLTFFNTVAFAGSDHAFLDPKYTHLFHPQVSSQENKSNTKNNVAAIIALQSSVKTQGSRGTCSIFSATALLEGLINGNLDLSEEWLEYIAIREKGYEGSDAPNNFEALRKYGMASEQAMPYIAENWVKVFNPLQATRCGHITDEKQKKTCLIIHFDPTLLTQTNPQDQAFANARAEAFLLREQYLRFENTGYYHTSTNQVKQHLDQGTAIVLELNFYFGAWNHALAEEYGIGRNMDHWKQGIVFAPEANSVDMAESNKRMSGHSVLVVGYDNERVITKTIKMIDGTTKTFSHKGVYYFKNSWGTEGFGKDFEIDGVKYPGYGMIVQKYANEQGAFFSLPALN
jgi:C1A family cysteine protease